jgi:SAM-dependent methyltransferase
MRSPDFGRTAGDYAQHRPGFPRAFFDAVGRRGFGTPGQRLLDVGTGTGTLARGFAARGSSVVGLDPSAEMLAHAAELARDEGPSIEWVCATAEASGQPDGSFDAVSAGQCWHWFDRPRAAAEVRRVLRPGGRVLIAYFSYLPEPGSVGAATEELILRYHPAWLMAGSDGRYARWADDLRDAGFAGLDLFEQDIEVAFTHESWRGRFRACNGVVALPGDRIAEFDADLAAMLAQRFPEPVISRHRVFGMAATRP